MFVDRALYFNANVLDQRDHGGQNQQQGDRIGVHVVLGSIDVSDEILPKENDAGSNQPQDDKLNTTHPSEEICKLLAHVRLAGRRNAVDPRGEHGGNSRGKLGKHRVDHRTNTVHSHRAGARHSAEDKFVHRPVDLVDDHVEEQEKTERTDLFEQTEIKMAEFERGMQLDVAEPDVGQQLSDRDTGGDANDCH